ncbi:MAG: tyrosine-type recombinase/integrase [Anaerolineae bacterium]
MSALSPYPTLPPALVQAVQLWAQATTNSASRRYHDLIHDKCQALLADGAGGTAAGFFAYARLLPHQVSPVDVQAWQAYLVEMQLQPATVYARVSRLSSFFEWLLKEPTFRHQLRGNPVKLARPKAPAPYQTAYSRALNDEEARQLLAVVQADAASGSLHAIRDYALLRFYFATGKRREEIIGLCWGDLRFTEEALIIDTQHKGGLYRASEVRDPGVKAALLRYLKASERWDTLTDTPLMEPDSPLWLRHDRAARRPAPVTSHGFVKAFKQYARRAGLGDVHLHQTRHTVARIVGEESGSLTDVQTFLGHQNLNTTRVYLDRIAVKRDRHSERIARRLIDHDEA